MRKSKLNRREGRNEMTGAFIPDAEEPFFAENAEACKREAELYWWKFRSKLIPRQTAR